MASYVKATDSLVRSALMSGAIEKFKHNGDLFAGIVRGVGYNTVDIQVAQGPMKTFVPLDELYILVDSVNEIMSRLD